MTRWAPCTLPRQLESRQNRNVIGRFARFRTDAPPDLPAAQRSREHEFYSHPRYPTRIAVSLDVKEPELVTLEH